MKLQLHNKIILSLIIIALFFSFVLFIPKTEALWGEADIGVDPATAGTTGATVGTTGANAGSNAAKLVKDFALDVVAYTIAQELANYLVSKFTTWVNSGFNGNPFYVPDQASFMKEFQDTEILKIYESIGDSASDRGTILSILEDQKKTLDQKLTPTLSSDQKYEYSGNFKKGAWSTWEELAKPANNPIGRSALIALEYKKKVEEKVTMSAGELLQGEGYLPKKECATFSDLQEQVQENNPDYIEIEEEEDVDDDLCPTGSIYAPYNAGADADGCIPFDGTANTTYGQGLGTAFNVELQNFTYDPSCERWETQTPGKLISNSINRASDQQFEGLTQADEFSEIASAALGSMVDVMINKGLSELKSAATSALDDALGGSGGNSNQGITYLGTDVDQTNPDGSVDWLNAPNGSVVWEREIPEAIRNAGEVMYYLENSVANGKEQLKMTETLDYLYPGPDIGWDDRLKDLFAKRSESEKRYLARKTNPNKEAEERMDRFNLLRRMFVQALTKQTEWVEDPSLNTYPEPQNSIIKGYIYGLKQYGRENDNTIQALRDIRNVFYRLKGIKDAIMGDSYEIGHYDEGLESWVGDTWFTREVTTENEQGEQVTINSTASAWDEWKNRGVVNGEVELIDGEPSDDVLERQALAKMYSSLSQDIPKGGIIGRAKNKYEASEFIIKDIEKHILFSEQFWADNYRIQENSEDFAYWGALYSTFKQYITAGGDWSFTRPNAYDWEGEFVNLGGAYRNIDYPGPDGRNNEEGGPWGGFQPRLIPGDWSTKAEHQFTPNGVLQSYVGTSLGVAGKLKQVKHTNWPGNDSRHQRVKAYSISETGTAIRNGSAAWNALRRDREERLFCGFQHYNEDLVSVDGDSQSIKKYDAIYCSDGWYHASSIDYKKLYDMEFATSLLGF